MVTPSGCPSVPRCTRAPTIPHQIQMHYSSRVKGYPPARGMYEGSHRLDLVANCTCCNYRVSPPNKRLNCRKGSSVSIVIANEPQRQRLARNNNYTTINGSQNSPAMTALTAETQQKEDTPTASALATRVQMKEQPATRSNWMITLCFRGQKVLRVPPASSVPPESVVFELSEQ